MFTVCYCLRRRDVKTQEGRGQHLTWGMPSLISVTAWLTAATFNGWKAFIPSALSQAWPVMVSLHGVRGGGGREVFWTCPVMFQAIREFWLFLDICSCQCWECPLVRKDTKEVGTDNQCGQWFWPLVTYYYIIVSSSNVHEKKTPPFSEHTLKNNILLQKNNVLFWSFFDQLCCIVFIFPLLHQQELIVITLA